MCSKARRRQLCMQYDYLQYQQSGRLLGRQSGNLYSALGSTTSNDLEQIIDSLTVLVFPPENEVYRRCFKIPSPLSMNILLSQIFFKVLIKIKHCISTPSLESKYLLSKIQPIISSVEILHYKVIFIFKIEYYSTGLESRLGTSNTSFQMVISQGGT